MAAAWVDVSLCQVVQALMVSLVVVMPNEGCDVRFKCTGQKVILQQDAVLERLMSALDLALRLRMIRRAACVRYALVLQIISQISGDIARTIV